MLDQRNWDRLVAIGVTSLGILLIKEIVSTRLKKIFYHHVGTVHRIEIFPLKGAKGIAVDEALITSHGVQVNGVQRSWTKIKNIERKNFIAWAYNPTR